MGVAQVRSLQVGATQLGLVKPDALQAGTGKLGTTQVGALEPDTDQRLPIRHAMQKILGRDRLAEIPVVSFVERHLALLLCQ